MFYLFAVGSMFGYALQNVLLAHHARKVDGLSLAFYRNISFIVTLLPLLFGASQEEIFSVLAHWRLLILAGGAGGIYLALFYLSYRYLTVGIAAAFVRTIMTVLLTAFGWIFLAEKLSLAALALILLIIVGSLALGMSRHVQPHLHDRFAVGVAVAALAAFFLAVTNYAPITLSRVADPLVAGYFWEVSIGIASGILILLRSAILKKGLQKVSRRTLASIALCSWPTLVGTGLYTLATRAGPVAIATSVGTATVVVSSLLAYWLYHERLTKTQWAAIVLVIGCIVGLKFT